MEPRARRLSNMREAPMGPAAQRGAKYSRSSSGRVIGSSSSLSLSVVLRVLLGLMCVGLIVQWVSWSSRLETPNNGWMTHLRRVEPETPVETPAPTPEVFEFEPKASDPTHGEEKRRRAPYDPALHNEDQKQVVEMVQWAWKGYATYAYGHDSLNVKTMTGTGLPDHDMALTLVDALDTLYIVGMFDEFDRASEWVANNMEQRIFLSGFISLFETTIRLMGGLLSSYYLSGHVHLLTIANKLGMALSPAFTEYDHGMPDKDFDIVWLMSDKKEEKFKTQYMTAVDGIMDKLVGKSKPNGLVFIGELVYGKFEPKMDHLVCFVPGMLALGYMNGMPEEHLTLAKQLMETCYQMYAQMEAKLAPEIMYFNMKENVEEDFLVSATDAFNLLRPETVESLMVMYRVTKDEKYREYGREIMRAFEKNCRLERGGYASVGRVAKGPVQVGFRSEMESFFIAETLKYLFLLFSEDSMMPLDKIVFNTEAHPFPIDHTAA
ncbi:hypothetical protein BBJ28_00017178 [Nothophytophthora sp. Chile5]|nr:hypothetical protein BBJ28_00017178 [Nothophytophthora sp. Chile5]